jgi:hypothetical protein
MTRPSDRELTFLEVSKLWSKFLKTLPNSGFVPPLKEFANKALELENNELRDMNNRQEYRIKELTGRLLP